jgi:DNA-binding MarR family transcriptional regulator
MNNDLYEKLTRLQWLLHMRQMDSYRRGGHLADTTRGQGRILAALQMRDGISTKDLSYLLGLAVSSLNEFLSKLERGGYVTREPSEQDKRVMLVKLTEKGKSRQGQPEEMPDFGDIFECLSDDEQSALGASLDKVTGALGEKLGFGGEELEWLKAANAERDRIFAEMCGMDGHGFGPHGFRGGFGGFPNRRGFPHGCGCPRTREFQHDHGFPRGRGGFPEMRGFHGSGNGNDHGHDHAHGHNHGHGHDHAPNHDGDKGE